MGNQNEILEWSRLELDSDFLDLATDTQEKDPALATAILKTISELRRKIKRLDEQEVKNVLSDTSSFDSELDACMRQQGLPQKVVFKIYNKIMNFFLRYKNQQASPEDELE